MMVLLGLVVAVVGGFSFGQFMRNGQIATPVTIAGGMVQHTNTWSSIYLVGVGIAVLVVAAILVAGRIGWGRMMPPTPDVDVAAYHLAAPKKAVSLTPKAVAAKSVSLGVVPADFVGLCLGAPVTKAAMRMYGSAEDVGLIFAGPRVGKSTSFGIPYVLDAPGPVIATENKRTLHDHTRGAREKLGRVFTFDAQGIVGEKATWWFNPLAQVTDSATAAELAGLFAAAEIEATSAMSNSDFFTTRGKTLLKCFFLAAAISQGHIPGNRWTGKQFWLRDVQRWVADPTAMNPEAVAVLQASAFPAVLNELAGIYGAAEEERSGVFSTASTMTESLANDQIADWVNPRPLDGHGAGRTMFDPTLFLEGANTLYSLSKDGAGSARALTTALTVSICTAAEAKAAATAGRRLATPLVVVLDEAANVCRWPNLPKLYSHYGSRGILVVTILQSYPQGEGVWGKAGMETLMEASNWVIYAGGNKPGRFLSMISDAMGDYYYTTPGSPGSSNSSAGPRQEHKDRVLDVGELAAMPRGRCVVLSSGNGPLLLRTIPWMQNPKHRELVVASLTKYDPAPEKTISDADNAVEAMRRNPNVPAGVAV
jgi:type IV secretory pathway TraG/TraD family ATPase VirD4